MNAVNEKEGKTKMMQKVVDVMPLTQEIKILKAAALGLPLTNAGISVIVMLVLAVLCIVFSIKFFRWE